ncbi:MAG: hypothetical protein SGBAC_006119 [Bacillariaceae sp.]
MTNERGKLTRSNSEKSGLDSASLTSKNSNYTSFSKWSNRSCGVPTQIDVATKEQRYVNASKFCMISMLILVAVAGCTGTFLYLKAEEEELFRTTFEQYASEIVAVSTEHVEATFSSIEALSNSISSYAKNSNQNWPEVVIPDWTSRASRTAALASGARLVTLAPLVKKEERATFETYANGAVHGQIQEDLDYLGIEMNATDVPGVVDEISWINISSRTRAPEPQEGPFSNEFLVNWQRFPFEVAKGRVFVMNNMLRLPTIRSAVATANVTQRPKAAFFEGILGVESQLVQPVFEDVFPESRASERRVVGFVWVVMGWGNLFKNLLPQGANGTVLVLESSCGFEASYEINGLGADFLGLIDAHDEKYNEMEISVPFFSFGAEQDGLPDGICIDQMTIRLFPSDTLKEANSSTRPLLYTGIVALVILATVSVFFLYDLMVARRQRKVMKRVDTQHRLVSDMFPETFRDRLYKIGDGSDNASDTVSIGAEFGVSTSTHHGHNKASRPIADLFLETTVIFIDIAGFTAWSSARKPTEVFVLLERLYSSFDKLCHRYGVFKVETVGDCFVAVCGLPEPQKDHAVRSAKFARHALEITPRLLAKLEITMGPDTADLAVRVGMHSGQVTAGVLRGERSRFQLFGDTVNVASRMETSGVRERIQVSATTAEKLSEQGRKKWLSHRGEIIVPGKGVMKTYWLETKAESDARYRKLNMASSEHDAKGLSVLFNDEFENLDSSTNSENSSSESFYDDVDDVEALLDQSGRNAAGLSKTQRLIEWNVEVLKGLLKQVVAARQNETNLQPFVQMETKFKEGLGEEKKTVLEEFAEIISLPTVSMKELNKRKDPNCILLPIEVVDQLRSVVSEVARCYNNDVPFHNFEHASHVTASVAKLLSRITTSDSTNQTSGPQDLDTEDIAGHSYGITSDPLTQFAVVFSAIIHDVGHYGVPNAQLVAENDPMVTTYKGKSMAEQNSVDVVWHLLMQPEYTDLRTCIYSTDDEMRRFRQLLVNVVMATDIADKELGNLRKARWNVAFNKSTEHEMLSSDLDRNRKATIVIEHLIQASDVSHTMQHWQVYIKWNEKFFVECYNAWQEGRAEKDPSVGWYKGEIGFFDFYIIPLAKKLDSCGVFGVSSHEYLNYATANRDEWIQKGESIVEGYLKKYRKDKNTNSEI